MISFIIIGRNVEKTLNKCLNSILLFIETNNIVAFEIIYVDSNSTDRSIDIAKCFPTNIFKIQGDTNAAIGRNEGAKVSKGEILFFIDGDMEIHADFYNIVFDKNASLIYPFVTGNFQNIYYSSDYSKLIWSENSKYDETCNFSTSITGGGLLIIEKRYWINLNGMDTNLGTNEDVDFSLRMAFSHLPLRIYNNLLANHNTISYYNMVRLSSFIFGKQLLYPGILIRKHILHLPFTKYLIRARYSMLLLLTSILLLFTNLEIGYMLLFSYIVLQSIRSYRIPRYEGTLFSIILFKFIFDIYSIIGLFLFFQKRKVYKVDSITN